MAKKNPSTRVYWNDLHNDPALQFCSLAARGLWTEILGICAANGGYLLFNGKPPSICEIARYVGAERRMVSRLLAELAKHGVFSRDENGTIFNRRMVREAGEKSARHKAQKNATRTDAKQPDLFNNSEPSRARVPFRLSKLSEEEEDLITLEGDSERPVGAFREVGEIVKTRMPARMADRHRDGVNDEQPSQAPAADNRGLARECQDHANPLAGGGQSATVGLSRPGSPGQANGSAASPSTRFDCRPAPGAARPLFKPGAGSRARPKTPALRGKIKDQLTQKHARFLGSCRPERELAAYWAAMLGDDPAEAQRVFDQIDRLMRAARWDDKEIAA